MSAVHPLGNTPARPVDAAVLRRCAEWVVRLAAPDATAADAAACMHWRAEAPEHAHAWEQLHGASQRFQRDMVSVPVAIARHTLLAGAVLPAPNVHRRSALRMLVLGIATGGVAWATWEHPASRASYARATADERTATGEQRTLSLPDGSQLMLDSASAVDVRFDASQRTVVLRAGRILITTAPDEQAPGGARTFAVETALGSLHPLGTRFTVGPAGTDAMRLQVLEGAVEVRPRHAAPQSLLVRVGAGQASTFTADFAAAPEADDQPAASWTQGLLVAERMRVADFVAELGRYRPGVLRCDPAVAELRVSGVFPLRDTTLALESLQQALPVQVRLITRYWVTVGPPGTQRW